ncbi:transcriptional regulator [Bacillus thuringiensis serovar roskildiensis]|uniref:Transcriptional regulator n=1 Tax=Bacillus thuringiensis serovar sooncheon TaxID=180891 RepID=A0A9Q5X4U4_BACTU|nr:helix-turn-helix transcriptional regulator [Bacillus thuringiensis]MEB9661373.1 helix-turn-helix transcriptional regulator [Bacillus cereus]ARV91365.1 transcriptional regulator [Bacillus thuringiensis]OTW70708.1 transcriptional regulator [Bacillus thuringiensis serovar coreanensis]OTX53147.1 transcriptional regulator [Bacillus thuringiensis serovar sooncheon]OTX56882.1 transcriptional regulator [Bacillus thuringiensis serovar guiyangiensis]
MKNRIKEVRKKNGDTLKDLAKKINYDYSNLSKIERGFYTPSIELLKRISIVYNVNLQYLIEMNLESKCTSNENLFIQDIYLDSDELFQKYNFILDGKQATVEEMELVIQIVRQIRKLIDNKN